MMGQTTTSYSVSWNGNCKYRLPCGYCELKKENCNMWQTISVPFDDNNKWRITPTWNPNLNEVTCDDK